MKKYFLIISLLVIQISIIYVDGNASALKKEFSRLFNQHNFVEAIKIADEIISLSDEKVDLITFNSLRGISNYRLENYNKALIDLETAIKFDNEKHFEFILLYKILTLLALGKDNEANEEIKRIKDNFFETYNYVLRAEIYFKLEDTLKALSDIKIATKLEPDMIGAYVLKFKYLCHNNKIQDAIDEIRTGLTFALNERHDKGSGSAFDLSSAYLYLSIIYYRLENYEICIENFKSAININNDFTGNYNKWFKYRDFETKDIEDLHKVKEIYLEQQNNK